MLPEVIVAKIPFALIFLFIVIDKLLSAHSILTLFIEI